MTNRRIPSIYDYYKDLANRPYPECCYDPVDDEIEVDPDYFATLAEMSRDI